MSGKVSKKETLSIISDTIDGHEDLKQDLMDVLYHHDSALGPDDFQLAPLRSAPALQPEIRLPSISASLKDSNQEMQSIDPAVLNGFGGYVSFEQSEEHEAPFAQHFDHFTDHPPLASAAVQEPTIDPLYPDAAAFPQEARYPEQWHALEYGDVWADTYFSNRDQYRASDRRQSPASDDEARNPTSLLYQHHPGASREPEPTSAHTLMSNHHYLEPSVLGAPYAIPIGQPAIDMPPPPKKRSRKSSAVQIKAEKPHESDRKKQIPARRSILKQLPTTPQSGTAESATKTIRTKSEGGVFIHGLCGKGFVSRSKVKKHHWGNRYDNLNTTTGCWAKHNKPNISWDDHPSCKYEDYESPSFGEAYNPTVRVHKSRDSSNFSNRQAVVNPTMFPKSPDVYPGFPTVQDLPQTVSQALNTPQSALRHTLKRDTPYYDGRMPSISKFESLLSAVNVASKIEAPIPKGRNDSVVSHLDAQAVAAERNGNFTSPWSFPSRGLDERFSYSQPSSPFVIEPALGHSIPRPNLHVPAHNVFSGYTFPLSNYTQAQPNFSASMMVPAITNNSVHRRHRSALREREMMGASTSSRADTKEPKI
jgi:hypothetical protein